MTSEWNKSGKALNIEHRGSVNEHYGFYQNQEKIITSERPDDQQTADDLNLNSFTTAQQHVIGHGEEDYAANYIEYEKMQRSTIMSYYDQDVLNECHRPSF